MKRIYITIFLLSLISVVTQAQIICLDKNDKVPVPGVVVLDSKGDLLGLTDNNGEVRLNPDFVQKITFSHMSYLSEERELKESDTVWLTPKYHELPEVLISANATKTAYTKMETLVRCYQYIDSVPVYFTDALIDFYIPEKGENLKYSIKSLRTYSNRAFLEQSKVESGSIRMGNNGFPNFLLVGAFPLSDGYLVVPGKESNTFDILKEEIKKGEIHKTPSGTFVVDLDILQEKEHHPKTIFGRTNAITSKHIRQTVASYAQGEPISPFDFLTYRLVVGLTTKYKANEEVPLLNITEIYVLSKSGMSKKEMKVTATSNYYGMMHHSIRPNDPIWESTPVDISEIPAVIQRSIDRELLLIE